MAVAILPADVVIFVCTDGPIPSLIAIQKLIRRNSGLLEDGPQSALRHIARVVWNRCVPIRPLIIPKFMTPRCLTIEGKAKKLQTINNLPVAESG